jgi:hypothetical protein
VTIEPVECFGRRCRTDRDVEDRAKAGTDGGRVKQIGPAIGDDNRGYASRIGAPQDRPEVPRFLNAFQYRHERLRWQLDFGQLSVRGPRDRKEPLVPVAECQSRKDVRRDLPDGRSGLRQCSDHLPCARTRAQPLADEDFIDGNSRRDSPLQFPRPVDQQPILLRPALAAAELQRALDPRVVATRNHQRWYPARSAMARYLVRQPAHRRNLVPDPDCVFPISCAVPSAIPPHPTLVATLPYPIRQPVATALSRRLRTHLAKIAAKNQAQGNTPKYEVLPVRVEPKSRCAATFLIIQERGQLRVNTATRGESTAPNMHVAAGKRQAGRRRVPLNGVRAAATPAIRMDLQRTAHGSDRSFEGDASGSTV